MRKILVALPLAFLMASCSTMTWSGQGPSRSDSERGAIDVDELTRRYETAKFWRSVRARRDGRVNAFGRDLAAIQNTLDRHFFNYSVTDPSVNYPTDLTIIDHVGRLGVQTLAR